jgi:hypothetical protein
MVTIALNIDQLPKWKQDEIVIDSLTRRVRQLEVLPITISKNIMNVSSYVCLLQHVISTYDYDSNYFLPYKSYIMS